MGDQVSPFHVKGPDGIIRGLDEHYDTMGDVAEDPHGAWLAIQNLWAERDALTAALKRLEYWFDTDAEILDAMTPDERADHMRQLTMIREALTSGQSY